MGIPMLKIRRSRLVFNMGIPIPVRWHLYIEPTPWSQEIFLPSLSKIFLSEGHIDGAVQDCGNSSALVMESSTALR